MRDKLVRERRAAVAANLRVLLQASRTLESATAGPACGRPDRPTPGCLRPAYATHSTLNAPDNTLLAHRPRQLAAWLMFTEPRYQRPAGGVVGFGAMPVVGDPPPPLVVRAGGL